MNREFVKEAIDAMETAYAYILENVAPGTPGKIAAVTELRHNVNRMVYEYAVHNINNQNKEAI